VERWSLAGTFTNRTRRSGKRQGMGPESGHRWTELSYVVKNVACRREARGEQGFATGWQMNLWCLLRIG